MMARQYDNDTVLHYVSTLLGMLWEHSGEAFLDEKLAGEETHTYILIQRNVKALI